MKEYYGETNGDKRGRENRGYKQDRERERQTDRKKRTVWSGKGGRVEKKARRRKERNTYINVSSEAGIQADGYLCTCTNGME